MALVYKDRVLEISTTTGTGAFTLAGTLPSFQTFAAIGDGNTCYYTIIVESEWEVGLGTYTASGTSLSRDVVLDSSNSGSLVDFAAGTKTVFVTIPADVANTSLGVTWLLPANNLSDLTNVATARTNLGLAIGSDVQAYDAATAKTDENQTFTKAQRGSITTLTDATTITSDFSDNNFFTVTLTDNRTLGNPSNLVAGQSGSIFIVQDGSGSHALAFDTYWHFVGGVAPSLSTAANAVDRLDYVVRSSTSIHAVLSRDVK